MDVVIEGLNGAQITNSWTVAATSLLLVDYLHTFPLEVELMWPAPVGTVKVVYMFARYTAVVQITFGWIFAFSKSLTAEQCSLVFAATGFTSIFNAFFSEAILYLSVHAFSGRTRRMRLFLGGLFVAKFIACTILLSKYFTQAKHIVLDLPGLHCVPINLRSHLVASAFVIPVGAETVLLSVMLWSAYHQYRNLRSALMFVFIRDGFIYLFGIAVLSIVNCVLAFTAPESIRLVLAIPQSVAIPLLATRMALHLRKTAHRNKLSEGITLNTRTEDSRSSHRIPQFVHPSRTTFTTVIDVGRPPSNGGVEGEGIDLKLPRFQ
ncbi:hypothetical protein BKA70DRAFT_1427504 [Coprinopsis sp. MPI-PUGE-AT-0042]|nr:hypothetical protein BKA70DRAFT_1427504 [Coprinopsis sp. MPI-PUGE-AT-0042]